MSKREKLIQRIFKGNSDVSPDEAMKILEMLGFRAATTSGSHKTYRKQDRPSVTIILTQNPLKSYMLNKLQDALKCEGYTYD